MHDVIDTTRRPRVAIRGELIGAGIAALLVAAAIAVPRIAGEQWHAKLYAGAAPIYGNWLRHVGWGTVPACVIALLVITRGPYLAERLRWRTLLGTAWVTAIAWAFALAMVDGWHRGFADRLTDGHEYLHEVPGVTDIPAMLRGFTGRILDFRPESWTTHVSGHPPGALLVFVGLDRIGLGGGAWAGAVCLLVGSSSVVAVAVALRALGAEDRARAALPYLALAPAAIWIAVSADALFAGVTAWAVALLAVATRGERGHVGVAVASGVLFGCGLYLNYGLVLMALPAVGVLLAGRTARPLAPALVGALAVVAIFTVAGFWWLDGYHLVVQRYYQGIASERPYGYWCWANLAATVCAVGLATAAALPRALSPRVLRAADPTALLVAAATAAILAADLSGLSKAETERIWLPFDMWLLAATAFLPRARAPLWLTVQAAGTLAIVHLIFTNW
ncbi:hypothetical protein [Nocardia arizonensis]|uniref:hypothetical protein n=1 Tax=Nocardia arizonensis TaxID=1141647 RepID=UPI0012E25A48|nr:hypothetical protein [Nocardia arizonensis]